MNAASVIYAMTLGPKEKVIAIWKGSVINVEHHVGKRRSVVGSSFDPAKAINMAVDYGMKVAK